MGISLAHPRELIQDGYPKVREQQQQQQQQRASGESSSTVEVDTTHDQQPMPTLSAISATPSAAPVAAHQDHTQAAGSRLPRALKPARINKAVHSPVLAAAQKVGSSRLDSSPASRKQAASTQGKRGPQGKASPEVKARSSASGASKESTTQQGNRKWVLFPTTEFMFHSCGDACCFQLLCASRAHLSWLFITCTSQCCPPNC